MFSLPRPKPICKFKVYADPLASSKKTISKSDFNDWCWVIIWDTAADLREANPRFKKCPTTYGFFSGYERWDFQQGKPDVLKPDFGTLGLCREKLTLEAISHEATHAAFELVRRHKLHLTQESEDATSVPKSEETFCYAVGRITQQIVTKGSDLLAKYESRIKRHHSAARPARALTQRNHSNDAGRLSGVRRPRQQSK